MGTIWSRLRPGRKSRSTSSPPLILFFNPDWLALPSEGPIGGGCCQLTFDRERYDDADAVIFHIPSLPKPMYAVKRPGQRWVAMSMESDVNYPALRDESFMAWFDLTMTYRLDSDVTSPYLNLAIAEAMTTPPKPKTEPVPAVYIASNARDHSGRNAYVSELMRYMPVDSYGKCLQNRTFVEDRGQTTKLDTITAYRFTLAFENSISHDYVTEKFFEPLMVGSVPVYLGAPNVADFAPSSHCYIDVHDFAGPEELSERLQQLAGDDDAYNRYLDWKTEPFRTEFLELVERLRVCPMDRLARIVASSD
ncbi:MAG: glycosyltransferase family 10 [Nitrolancea sp.]